jgi:hypothetical protein
VAQAAAPPPPISLPRHKPAATAGGNEAREARARDGKAVDIGHQILCFHTVSTTHDCFGAWVVRAQQHFLRRTPRPSGARGGTLPTRAAMRRAGNGVGRQGLVLNAVFPWTADLFKSPSFRKKEG